MVISIPSLENRKLARPVPAIAPGYLHCLTVVVAKPRQFNWLNWREIRGRALPILSSDLFRNLGGNLSIVLLLRTLC